MESDNYFPGVGGGKGGRLISCLLTYVRGTSFIFGQMLPWVSAMAGLFLSFLLELMVEAFEK